MVGASVFQLSLVCGAHSCEMTAAAPACSVCALQEEGLVKAHTLSKWVLFKRALEAPDKDSSLEVFGQNFVTWSCLISEWPGDVLAGQIAKYNWKSIE